MIVPIVAAVTAHRMFAGLLLNDAARFAIAISWLACMVDFLPWFRRQRLELIAILFAALLRDQADKGGGETPSFSIHGASASMNVRIYPHAITHLSRTTRLANEHDQSRDARRTGDEHRRAKSPDA